MPDIVVVYWRDLPAQVIVGKGRRGAKRQLAARFEQAIDRAAMRSGAHDTESYLADWRKQYLCAKDGRPDVIAEAEARRLEIEYSEDRVKDLIANNGWNITK